MKVYDGPVIVIVGATGSGKTGVAIEVAKLLGGEVISADSRAIYKHMDIGTAKPSVEEMDGVDHHGLDLVEPGERFTVVDWKKYAEQKICSIKNRGKVPIIAGGTGLYVDALVYDYQFSEEAKKNYTDRKEISAGYQIYGIKWTTEELRERLKKRIEIMYKNKDLYKETEFLVKKYGWGSQAMMSDIYQFVWSYMQGAISLEEAKKMSFLDDWHLAKRQITWFKRNEHIKWYKIDEIVQKIVQNS